MKFLQMLKSKTINFNALATSVVAILTALGVVIPVEVVTGFFAIGNFILLLLTKEPVSAK